MIKKIKDGKIFLIDKIVKCDNVSYAFVNVNCQKIFVNIKNFFDSLCMELE